jgi:hypothetical protein
MTKGRYRWDCGATGAVDGALGAERKKILWIQHQGNVGQSCPENGSVLYLLLLVISGTYPGIHPTMFSTCNSFVVFLAYSSTLNVGTLTSSETSVNFYLTAQGYTVEARALNSQCYENFKFIITYIFF